MQKPMQNLLASAAAIAAALSFSNQARADEENRISLGVFLGGHIFSNNNEIGASDVPDADSPSNVVIGGVRVGYRIDDMFTAEGELAIMPSEARNGSADLTAFGFRVQGLAHFTKPDAKFRPFAALGTSAMVLSSSDERVLEDDTDWVGIHGGGGVKYRIDERTSLRADARLFLPPSSASESVTTDWEFTIGLHKTFGPAPKPAPAEPEPPGDKDGDGLTDDVDKCVDQAEDKDGFQDDDGCPDADNDGDGIADGSDRCPDKAETMNGVDDDDGCPESDEDGDGVLGTADKCPAQPEDPDGFDDKDGCPDLDNDNDGIVDTTDQCPAEPETANGYEDDDGCPDQVPDKVKKFTGAIKGIRFANGKATLLRSSFKVLDQAIAVLKEYPALKVEIQGYTDSRGELDFNLKLSQARADSVMEYLVKNGIAADRLKAVGYGEANPIADNKTKQGRFENRRVEFKLVQ
jgi:OOP family OmpA-OmpF porin